MDDNHENIKAAADRHAERAARLFRWSAIIGKAGEDGHIPMEDVIEIGRELNDQAIAELDKALALQQQFLKPE